MKNFLKRIIGRSTQEENSHTCRECGATIHPWEDSCEECGEFIAPRWLREYSLEELREIREERGVDMPPKKYVTEDGWVFVRMEGEYLAEPRTANAPEKESNE